MGWGFRHGGWSWAVFCLVPQFTCNIVCSSFYFLNLLFEQKAFIKQSKERSWTWAQRSGMCSVLYLSLPMVAFNPLSYLLGLGSGRDRAGMGFPSLPPSMAEMLEIPPTFFCQRTFSLLFASTKLVAEAGGSRKRGWARLGCSKTKTKTLFASCLWRRIQSQREEIMRLNDRVWERITEWRWDGRKLLDLDLGVFGGLEVGVPKTKGLRRENWKGVFGRRVSSKRWLYTCLQMVSFLVVQNDAVWMNCFIM